MKSLKINMNLQASLNWIRYRLACRYINYFCYGIPAFTGKLFLSFYRFLYPNFSIGHLPKVWGKFYINMHNPFAANIQIGDNFWGVSEEKRSGITFFCRLKLTVVQDGIIRIGNNVVLNGTVITSTKRIEIEDNTIIAPNVIIVDSDFHNQWPPEKRFDLSISENDKGVQIGKNVWIGMNSIILKDVSIGDNSIIGAGSVVSKSIPNNVIAAGNPAKVVKSFSSS